MRIPSLILTILAIPCSAVSLPAEAQVVQYSDIDLADWSFGQWVASLDGSKSRPDPAGPIIVEFTQASTSRDQLAVGNPRAFNRWCVQHGGAGAYTPKSEVWMIDVFRTGVPFSAYGQAALRRDGELLDLPDGQGESERYFENCSDGKVEGLGTFALVAATRCFPDENAPRAPVSCRALIYDEIAMTHLRASVDPAFAAFDEARRKSEKEEAERIAAWRENIRPGDQSQIGLVIDVNGAVAQVQDEYGRTRWFPVSELQPTR